MFKAKTLEGKEVEGYYCQASGRHLIILVEAELVNPNGGLCFNPNPDYYIDGWVEVAPETVIQTGGKQFGEMKAKITELEEQIFRMQVNIKLM